MEKELLIIIVVLFIGVVACFCWLFYTIGYIKGMKKMKEIDSSILDEVLHKYKKRFMEWFIWMIKKNKNIKKKY